MPQASNSRIPPAYDGCTTPPRKDNTEEKDSTLGGGRASSATHAPSAQQRGVFPFSWEWQLAGLIAAIITGPLLVIAYFFSGGTQPYLIVTGLAILGPSIYSAVKTNWLRDTVAKPLPLKIGAGTAVICGLVPIGAALAGLAIAGAICAVVFGALGALGGK